MPKQALLVDQKGVIGYLGYYHYGSWGIESLIEGDHP